MVGFGAIGQGVLPLLLRHIDMAAERITIVTADSDGLDEARAFGIDHRVLPLTSDNYRDILAQRVGAGDFLLNLAVNVASVELIRWCRDHGVLYLDACIEPWAGGYTDPSGSASVRSNYGLREAARALRKARAPTAVLTHGANPGWVSHFIKQALLDVARDCGLSREVPAHREDWARLAQSLGIRAIHIAERDWQLAPLTKRPGEFVNTWSVDGFIGESCQPAELGWGSHERHFPADGHRHGYGCEAAIYLDRPGAATRVRSWTPLGGPMHAFLVTHGEAVSIADYLTIGNGANPKYRPTCHYAYQPCDDAVLSLHELAGREWRAQDGKRIVRDEARGVDELGVLLMGHPRGAYWLGSRLSTERARTLAPYNSATTLQVAAGVMAAVVWAMRNPDRGVVDPDEMPFDEILALCRPYLGQVFGAYSDWTPLKERQGFFPESVDSDDCWQFLNFRVA